jgi:hypothetical protein
MDVYEKVFLAGDDESYDVLTKYHCVYLEQADDGCEDGICINSDTNQLLIFDGPDSKLDAEKALDEFIDGNEDDKIYYKVKQLQLVRFIVRDV